MFYKLIPTKITVVKFRTYHRIHKFFVSLLYTNFSSWRYPWTKVLLFDFYCFEFEESWFGFVEWIWRSEDVHVKQAISCFLMEKIRCGKDVFKKIVQHSPKAIYNFVENLRCPFGYLSMRISCFSTNGEKQIVESLKCFFRKFFASVCVANLGERPVAKRRVAKRPVICWSAEWFIQFFYWSSEWFV